MRTYIKGVPRRTSDRACLSRGHLSLGPIVGIGENRRFLSSRVSYSGRTQAGSAHLGAHIQGSNRNDESVLLCFVVRCSRRWLR